MLLRCVLRKADAQLHARDWLDKVIKVSLVGDCSSTVPFELTLIQWRNLPNPTCIRHSVPSCLTIQIHFLRGTVLPYRWVVRCRQHT